VETNRCPTGDPVDRQSDVPQGIGRASANRKGTGLAQDQASKAKGVWGMAGSLTSLARVAAGVILVLFVLFVVNQTAQVVALADRVSPLLGSVVLWTLLAAYAGAGLYIWFQYVRLPKPLRPPASKDSPEYPRYLEALKARLRRNPYVQGMPLETEADLQKAMVELGKRADEVTRSTALQVFLMTAVSQNGSLDAIAVLAAQSRMVWQIARIYNQRPTARELAALYANVAMAALLSRQLEEMDASEMLQPLLSSIMPSTLSAVPGMQTASILFAQAVLSGSANAYGTLRVGVIAKRYCGSLTMPEPSALRKAAFAEAMLMTPSVVQQGAETVFDLLKRAAAKTVVDSTKKATAAVVDTVSRGVEQIKQGAQQVASSSAEKVRGIKIRWPFRRAAAPRGSQHPPGS